MKINLLLLLILPLFIFGCSNKSKDGVKNLQFVWYADGNETEIIKKFIAEFEKENPKIKIEIIPVSYSQHKIKAKIMISGKQPPALLRTPDPAMFRSFTVDLSDIVKKENYVDAVYDYFVTDERTIALPLNITANGMIINTEIFDKAGIKYPTSPDNIWTWDEFITEMQKLKPYTKYPGIFDASSFRWATMLYEYGGSIWDKTRTKIEISKEPGIKALKFCTSFLCLALCHFIT
jgi:alpha-1,4-digalacturonate transport system substrate-binding protein